MSEFNDYLNEWFYKPIQKNKSTEQLAKELFIQSLFRFPDKQGKTLIHHIANKFFEFRDEFRLALIKVLFDQKADANAIDHHGRTALHDLLETWQDTPFSFAEKFEAIAELFFQQGAQFTLRDNNKKTPLDVLLDNPNYNPFVIKVLIKFTLLRQPHLTPPNTVTRHKQAMEYWNIYQNSISRLLEQKIADSGYTLYDICSSSPPTHLVKPLYRYYDQLKEFTSEAFKNKFYEYSDRLQSNLEKIQQKILKIKIINDVLDDSITFSDPKNNVLLNEDVMRIIFNYLSTKEVQIVHVAASPQSLFKYNPQSPAKVDVKNKPTLSCCCNS